MALAMYMDQVLSGEVPKVAIDLYDRSLANLAPSYLTHFKSEIDVPVKRQERNIHLFQRWQHDYSSIRRWMRGNPDKDWEQQLALHILFRRRRGAGKRNNNL